MGTASRKSSNLSFSLVETYRGCEGEYFRKNCDWRFLFFFSSNPFDLECSKTREETKKPPKMGGGEGGGGAGTRRTTECREIQKKKKILLNT